MSWLSDASTVVPLVVAAGFGVGGYLLSRAVSGRIRERGAPPHVVRGIRIAVSIVGLVLAVVTLTVAFGPLSPISGLTFSGFAGIVATLALQTTIANVIAGYILLRDRVLRINDVIQISGVSGKVVRIGLVTCWLRQEDGSLVSVSNSSLLGGPLINRSVGDRLRGEF